MSHSIETGSSKPKPVALAGEAVPSGRIRSFLFKTPVWAIAAVLSAPAVILRGFDFGSWQAHLTADILLFVALVLSGALRRLRIGHLLAMIGVCVLIYGGYLLLIVPLGAQSTGMLIYPAKTANLLGIPSRPFGWLAESMLLLCTIGLFEMLLVRRRWRALFNVLLLATTVAMLTLIFEEIGRLVGWFRPHLEMTGPYMHELGGAVFAGVRAMLFWTLVPLALRPRGPKRWRRDPILAGAAVTLVAFVFLFLVAPHPGFELDISEQTTVLIEPLNADGTVNYVAAYNLKFGHGVTPENNAAVLFAKATGPELVEAGVREEAFKRMGIPVPPKSGQYALWPWEFARQQAATRPAGAPQVDADLIRKQLKKAVSAPWSPEQFPDLAEWLSSQKEALRWFEQASRRTRFYVPLLCETDPPNLMDAAIASYGRVLLMGKASLALAMRAAGEGDMETACIRLLVARRMARLVAQDGDLSARLVGRALEESAAEAVTTLATTRRLTAEQARQWLERTEALSPLAPVAPILTYEQCIAPDTMFTFARDAAEAIGRRFGRPPPYRVTTEHVDWNQTLRRFARIAKQHFQWAAQQPLSRRRATEDGRSDIERVVGDDMSRRRRRAGPRHATHSSEEHINLWTALLGLLEGPQIGRQRAAREFGDLMFVMSLGDYGGAMEITDKQQTITDLSLVALALATYEAERGEFPETLDALAPTYLKTVPADHLTGKPLHYERTDDGYLLYSVGTDLQDDGGDPEADLVVRVPAP